MFASAVGSLRRLVTGVAAASLVLGVLAGVFATAASAATTTSFTLKIVTGSGTYGVHSNTPASVLPGPSTFSGKINPVNGKITTGTLSVPPWTESNRGTTETFTLAQVTPKSATGSIDTHGNVTLVDTLSITLHITAPITNTCKATPIHVKLVSTAPYTGGQVKVSDTTFTIPNFTAAKTNCGLAAGSLNTTYAGSTGNLLKMTLTGTLPVPSSPTLTSSTILAASPSGTNVAGQPTTLTATVYPTTAVTGSVTFENASTVVGTVTLVSGVGTLTTSTLPVGRDALSAVYSGDGTYLASTSPAVNYTVTAAPTVNINWPSSVTLGATAVTFTGTVSNPGNGPALPSARLTLAVSSTNSTLASTAKTKIKLYVCKTASFAKPTNCGTTSVLTTGGPVPTTPIKGRYGTTVSTSTPAKATTFALAPGTTKQLYFRLQFPTTAGKYGFPTFTASLVRVNSGSGASATVTVLATQTTTITVKPTTTTPSFTIKLNIATATTTGTPKATRQGYRVEFKVSVNNTTSPAGGPSPSGTLIFYRTATTPGKKQAIGAALSPKRTVVITNISWTPGTYKISVAYSGDAIYPPSTTASTSPMTLQILPPPAAGVAYACSAGVLGSGFSNYRAYVTTAKATLPASAAAGSTISLSNLTVSLYGDNYSLALGSGALVTGIGFDFSPGGTGVGSLPTGVTPGAGPIGTALDPTTHTVYTANNLSNNVSVITATTHKVTGAVTVGTGPDSVAVDPTTDTVYAANKTSKTVSVITGTTDAVTHTLTVGSTPASVAVDPTTHKVYVANAGSNSVSVITGVNNTIVKIATPATPTTKAKDKTAITVGTKPDSVAVDPVTHKVYVANTTSHTVSIITGTSVVASPAVVSAARGVAVDPVTDKIYVANYSTAKKVSIITGATNALTATTPTVTVSVLATNPWAIAVDPVANKIIVSNATGNSSRAAVITGATNVVTATPAVVGKGPKGIAVDPTTRTVFTANTTANTVSVFDESAPATISTVALYAGYTVATGSKLTNGAVLKGTGTVSVGTQTGSLTVGLTNFRWNNGSQNSLLRKTYTCVPVGKAATIGTVTVKAAAAPAVTTQPADQAASVGTTATFTATATGEAAPSVQWQSSTDAGTTWANVTGATTATQGTGTTTATYTTPTTTATDNGVEYRAVFTNASGTATSDAAVLTVNVPPVVREEPGDQVVTAGQTATFSAAAPSRPTPTVQWQVSSDDGTTWENVPGATSTTYAFSAKPTQSGNEYRAVFTNTLGSATSDPATLTVTTTAYRLAGSDGSVFDFGTAPFYGSMGGQTLNQPIVGMADTPTGGGYWLVASDGGIFSFGDAQFYGSTGAMTLNQPIVGMAPTPDGGGYWLVASDGGIFAFGDAQFYGSTGAMTLNKPVVGMAPTPDGQGYWLVASDGGIFAFGDAQFYGSTGSLTLNKPIVGMAPTPTGTGYWLVASDGGIFCFGTAQFYGSLGGGTVTTVVGIAPSPDGGGYLLAAADGSLYGFGDAPLAGTARGLTSAPIAGVSGW